MNDRNDSGTARHGLSVGSKLSSSIICAFTLIGTQGLYKESLEVRIGGIMGSRWTTVVGSPDGVHIWRGIVVLHRTDLSDLRSRSGV